MKNTMKCFGVIALVAIIGFSMISCDLGPGGGGGNPINPNNPNNPNNPYTPPNNPITGGSGTEASPYQLAANGWADGSITSTASGAAVWYSFAVTSGATYYVWLNDGYTDTGDGTKTLDVKMSASGAGTFTSTDSAWASAKSFTASSTGTVKIKVERYSGTGTFAIAFTTSNTRPGTGAGTEASPYPLTAGVWANGSLASSASVVWYSFSVTNAATYYIWWNDGWTGGGDGSKTADVKVSAYQHSGTSIFTGEDSAWSAPKSFTASATGTVKIKVESYSSDAGTFAVAYNTSNNRPGSSHTHTYGTAWLFDETQHWHECTEDGAKDAVANHTSANICTVCGYWKWIAVPNSPFTSTEKIDHIVYGNGVFVAVSDYAHKIATSTDGINWTSQTKYYGAIAYVDGKFLAADSGGNREIYYSTDGAAWTEAPNKTNIPPYVTAIAYGGGRYVIVGHTSLGFTPRMATSTDGAAWTAVDYEQWANDYFKSIAYGGGRFIAGQDGGQMLYSTNGTTWTAMTNPLASRAITSMAYGNNRFVIGSSGGTAYSTDGTTWSTVGMSSIFPVNSAINAIAYGSGSAGSRFVAVGPYGGKFAHSPDGAAWTGVDSTFGYGTTVYGIAYGNGKFVAVGGSGKMAYAEW